MEWSRAKTILIIAYAAFNIFLGYRIWTDPGRGSQTLVTSQQVEAAAQDLAARGVFLSTPVPRRAPPMALMLLRHQEMTEEESVALFFEDDSDLRKTEKGDGRVILENANESLMRYENGILVYNRKNKPQTGEITEASARRLAQEFWAKRGGLPSGARPDYVAYDERSGRYIVQYYQEHGGFPIYGGQISVVVGPGGVETVLYVWFSPAGPSGKPRLILTATDALVRSFEALGRGGTVDSLTLGYYSEAYNAKQWEAPPVWRIRTRSGDTYYVNAYTGDLESPMSLVP